MQQRGQEDRDMIFLRASGIDEAVVDIQKSHFSRVVLAVCRSWAGKMRKTVGCRCSLHKGGGSGKGSG